MTSLDRFVDIPSHVVSQEVGGDAVLLDLEAGTYFGLDPVGARVWELMRQGLSLRAVCDELLKEFDVAPEEVQGDVVELCDRLVAENLVALRS